MTDQEITYPVWIESSRLPHTSLEVFKNAYQIVMELMTGRRHYSPVHPQSKDQIHGGELAMIKVLVESKYLYEAKIHPFSGVPLGFGYTLAGKLGISASIGDFIWKVEFPGFLRSEDNKPEFTIWGFPVLTGDKNMFMIVAEVTLHSTYGDEVFFCSGMTNFSGEGSAAMCDMVTVMNFWAMLYGTVVQYRQSTWEAYQQFEDYINEH